MNIMKKCGTLILTAVLCANMAACGEDWRESGVVADTGVIVDGEGYTIDVALTLDDSSAYFYWNDPDHVLYTSVDYPFEIPDAQEYYNSVSFDDVSGDGASDINLTFVFGPGDSISLTWIYDTVDGYVFQEDQSVLPVEEGDVTEYVGLWEDTDENVWIRIHEDKTWELLNDQEDVIASGTLTVNEDGITLLSEDTGDEISLGRSASGDLLDNDGGVLVSAEVIVSRVPYFTRNGLDYNARMDMGSYLLEDGICSFTGLGDGFNNGDCYWEVVKKGDYTHDGIRELYFDAICYVPKSSIPYFGKDYILSCTSELYDFYTGKWFSAATSRDGSDRAENHYVDTVEWQGETCEIEFAYSIDWQHNVGDWNQILTKSYVVYLPEGYDGLVFAAEAEATNYKDYGKHSQLDSIMPGANLMDIDLVEADKSLYFNICG